MIRACFNCCTGRNILFRSLQFIGACKDRLMVIVTELLPGMSLRKYLISIRPNPLELHVAIKFALDIAHAMECLHANGIIHRDLKPGTIWLVWVVLCYCIFCSWLCIVTNGLLSLLEFIDTISFKTYPILIKLTLCSCDSLFMKLVELAALLEP